MNAQSYTFTGGPCNHHQFYYSITAIWGNILFPTRTPTKDGVKGYQDDGDYLELMANTPEWDPHSKVFEELESCLVDRFGRLIERPWIKTGVEAPFQLSVYVMTTSPHPGKWNLELLA